MLESLHLEFGVSFLKLFVGNRKLSPFLEDATGLGLRSALELCFDAPWKVWTTIFVKDNVGDVAVDVFGVDEETVHVKETASHWWEAVK